MKKRDILWLLKVSVNAASVICMYVRMYVNPGEMVSVIT